MENDCKMAGRHDGFAARQAVQVSEPQFVDSCPEDLQCQICLGVAVDPLVTEECGHLFCRHCITLALEHKRECPVDRSPITVNNLRKDIRSHRRIINLRCYCLHREQGCQWEGEYGNLQSHVDRCEHVPVECAFAPHGCNAVVSRRNLHEHIAENVAQHLALMCTSLTVVMDENTALQQELELYQRENRFVWVIPRFEQKRGPLYSRKFFARGLFWYIGVDFESPDDYAGVYLFAEGHTKRVDFKLFLYNQDPSLDKVHEVNDWSLEYKGKGWGPLKFINRAASAPAGFLVGGCIRIGVEIDGEPFE